MANQIAYGFTSLKDVFGTRVTQLNVTQLNTAIAQSFAVHNATLNAMMSLFVDPTTDAKRSYKQGGLKRLQPADEIARARPTRGAAAYDVGFPVQKGMDALGLTFEARAKITVSELNDLIVATMEADKRWMRDHLLAALLDNTSWTFTDDYYGSLTVQPLANNDAITYNLIAGADAGATDNHYLAQTAAIADATNPYDDIREELLEHPENGGEVIAIIPTGLTTTTKALANFTAMGDPNITPAAADAQLTGALGVTIPGRLIGYTDGVWVVEWRQLPASTILAVATEGNRALGMRQHPEAELQGFGPDDERNDYPYYERQYARRAGFGGNNRVGAVVYEVSNGDTTYDIPSGFTTPMW